MTRLAHHPEPILYAMAKGVTQITRADGTIVYRARLMIDGRSHDCGCWPTEDDAIVALKAKRSVLSTDLYLPGAKTLRDYGATWLDRRETRGRVRGARKERSAWEHVLVAPFADLPLRELRRGHVVRWVTERLHEGRRTKAGRKKVDGAWVVYREVTDRPLARGTVVHALRMLRTCLAEALDAELVTSNVAWGVHVPRVDETREPWTWLRTGEIVALLDPTHSAEVVRLGQPRGEQLPVHVPEEARLLWTVAIYTGLRKGELAGLRWRDVHLDARPYLEVRRSYREAPKSGKAREVPLLPPAVTALRRWRELAPGVAGASVWPSDSGGVRPAAWDPGGWVERSRRLLGRHVRFHDLRHTCASHLVQGTWGRALSLYEAGAWLGHAEPRTTQRYAHLAPEGIHGIAEQMARAFERGEEKR